MDPKTHAPSEIAMLRAILDAVPLPVFVKDAAGKFIVINRAMCDFMQQDYEDVIGKSDHDFFPKAEADIFVEKDRHVMQTGEINENEELFTDGSGEIRTITTRKNRVEFQGKEPLLIGCISDITDFRRAESKIRHHATHDHLTGIANRALFEERLRDGLVAEGANRIDALLLVDLDGFKPVNDELGHPAGDNVLVQAVARLNRICEDRAFVARLGGDEFVVLAYGRSDDAKIAELAARIVQELARPMLVEGRLIAISASVGVAMNGFENQDREILLRQADQALYAAKNSGRNRWCPFQPALEAQDDAA